MALWNTDLLNIVFFYITRRKNLLDSFLGTCSVEPGDNFILTPSQSMPQSLNPLHRSVWRALHHLDWTACRSCGRTKRRSKRSQSHPHLSHLSIDPTPQPITHRGWPCPPSVCRGPRRRRWQRRGPLLPPQWSTWWTAHTAGPWTRPGVAARIN